jgi:hypothetical protein
MFSGFSGEAELRDAEVARFVSILSDGKLLVLAVRFQQRIFAIKFALRL